MPNWVKTKILFPDATDEQFDQIVKKYCTKLDDGSLTIDFEKIIPMPENVFRGNLGPKEEEMYPGELNWYYWRLRHWGTKWNAHSGEVDDFSGALYFETAWSYADPVIFELAKQTRLQIDAIAINEDFSCGAEVTRYYIDDADGEVTVEREEFDYGTDDFWEAAEDLWGISKKEWEEERE